jgi:predicted homoserine dehydrogenase-like protein
MIGYRPVAAGNLKGLIDPYRTPETQRAFAEKVGQDPRMITSYADGTKLSMEATILANATGFHVARRGMYGHRCDHVRDAVRLFPLAELLDGGLVDYLLGAEPHTGAFVLGYTDHPVKQHYLRNLKMGEGPLYVFYTPYHLPHLQVIPTVARAVLFKDATVAPRGAPVCDVLTVAKRDLNADEVLDGIGGFASYGVIDNADVVARNRLLPMGLAEGCRLTRALRRDEPITYDDVRLPEGRLVDQLRAEQAALFGQVSTASGPDGHVTSAQVSAT